ncbi:MAG: hypothetical protein IJ272_07080 [Clostridia bacterium]|nr:hypothetical protein [Clostridia bacterium]
MFEVGQHVRVNKDNDGFFVGSEGVIENIVDELIGIRFYMFKDEMLRDVADNNLLYYFKADELELK